MGVAVFQDIGHLRAKLLDGNRTLRLFVQAVGRDIGSRINMDIRNTGIGMDIGGINTPVNMDIGIGINVAVARAGASYTSYNPWCTCYDPRWCRTGRPAVRDRAELGVERDVAGFDFREGAVQLAHLRLHGHQLALAITDVFSKSRADASSCIIGRAVSIGLCAWFLLGGGGSHGGSFPPAFGGRRYSVQGMCVCPDDLNSAVARLVAAALLAVSLAAALHALALRAGRVRLAGRLRRRQRITVSGSPVADADA